MTDLSLDGLYKMIAHIYREQNAIRDTAATWMANNGVSMCEIAGMLGHSNSKTTEQVYVKHSPDYLQDAVAVLDQISLVPRRKRLKRHRGGIKPSKAA